MINLAYILIIIICTSCVIKASNSKLVVPRFVSIKSNEVNARTGPSIQCPIEWVFVKKGEPVEIIAEYGQWRKIQDITGEGGWVHSSVLSGKRTVIIQSTKEVELTKNPQGKIIASVMPEVRCYLKKCKVNQCLIECKNYTGWLFKENIWGVYTDDKNY